MAISPTTKVLQIPHGDQAPLKEEEAGKVDHLSNLSDELLVTIFSSLPTGTAVRTSDLCRRFRNIPECSLQNQIASLHNCHALESLKLAHKDAQMYYKRYQQCNRKKSKKAWQSKL